MSASTQKGIPMLRHLLIAGLLAIVNVASVVAAEPEVVQSNKSSEILTLGGGCFWCLEAVFDELKGVTHVESGFAGGNVPNPSY
jgi:peptide-methionine (S)-S-oxide reductase